MGGKIYLKDPSYYVLSEKKPENINIFIPKRKHSSSI